MSYTQAFTDAFKNNPFADIFKNNQLKNSLDFNQVFSTIRRNGEAANQASQWQQTPNAEWPSIAKTGWWRTPCVAIDEHRAAAGTGRPVWCQVVALEFYAVRYA